MRDLWCRLGRRLWLARLELRGRPPWGYGVGRYGGARVGHYGAVGVGGARVGHYGGARVGGAAAPGSVTTAAAREAASAEAARASAITAADAAVGAAAEGVAPTCGSSMTSCCLDASTTVSAYYSFTYNGGHTSYVGVMAQEVQNVMPEAVTRDTDGYLRVSYDKLGLPFETYDQWLATGARLPTPKMGVH